MTVVFTILPHRVRHWAAWLYTLRRSPLALAMACFAATTLTLMALAPRPAATTSVRLEPIYGRERGPAGSYRWSAPSSALEMALPQPAETVLVVQRLSAGPQESRPLTIRTAALTTTFDVASGVAPRVYRYLLPPDGRYVYGRVDTPPLLGTRDTRALGLAVFGTVARPLLPAAPSNALVVALVATVAAALALALDWRWLALVMLALAMHGRAPQLFYEPRLWAEEGSRYFRYAHAAPWWNALLHPQLGYYALVPNVASVVAQLVPLQRAPLVTTLIAGIVQLLPFVVVLWGDGPLWARPATKLATCLILLLAPVTAELWLTTITSQFHLLLAACLALIDEGSDERALRRWIVGGLLLLAGLSGPLTCLLAPLFFWKAWRTRSPAATWHGILLAGCGTLQLWALLVSAGQREAVGLLERLDGAWIVASVWAKTVPLLSGFPTGELLAELLRLRAQHPAQHLALWVVLAFGAATLAWLLARAAQPPLRSLILASYALIVAAALLLGVIPARSAFVSAEGGYRYFYVPNVLVLLLVFSAALHQRARNLLVTTACGLVLTLVLVRGAMGYRQAVALAVAQPPWTLEVARWHVSPDEQLHIWPVGWHMELSRYGISDQKTP